MEINCGRGLAPECGVSVDISLADMPHSGASPLPQGFVVGQKALTTRQNCHRHGARSGCASGGRPPRVRSRIPR
ncbi:hypothetical protein FHG55_16105 [Pseudomonas jessenii]|uniref:Uncharacterized protein n=1 Tax=Pseudomonas jessenii TaxID=77298 RepID=A0A5C4KVT2_PSEJE|nr:hypothetical protein FHG55_16105 [Pseudomonas jessenii]